MIVNINDSNFQEYSDIFTEAFKELKKKGYINENTEKTSFSSLAEYYSHMADLFATGKYKYVLLPIWIGKYQYNKKDFGFIVNGENGKVAGKYPVSAIKVVFTVLIILILIFLFVYFYMFA